MPANHRKAQKGSRMSGTGYYQVQEEKRRYPRIVIDRLIEIEQADGSVVSALAHDISPDGLQIRCDRDTAKTLNPSETQIEGDKGPEFKVRLSLPLQEGLVELGARCKTLYRAVIPGAEGVAFGMQFKEFEGDSFKYLLIGLWSPIGL
ncbi:MAG: PilZ domain-containing protein [Gammaproteobacteria bacterium]|nr:PilZ domain-containing protein [Gammaproteobacteria bacterium]